MIVIKHRRCRDVILLQVKARRLHGHDFSGAFLVQAALSGTSCVGARFPGANLREADFRDADLRDAIFCGANLRGAEFYGADLRGADLRGANLENTTLTGVIHDRRTRWPEGWIPEPSAPPHRRRELALPAVWLDRAGTQLLEWGRPAAAGWTALPVRRMMALQRAGLERSHRSGAPWISTLVLASGMVVAAAAILKQQAVTPRHGVAQAPPVMVAPQPSRPAEAKPLPQPRLAARSAATPQARSSAPERPARMPASPASRPRRTVLARSVPHHTWREVVEVPHHRVTRRALRIARGEAVPDPTARSGASTSQEPTSTRSFVARVPTSPARRVVLAEFTPVEQSAPAEQPARGTPRKPCKKRHDEPEKPRAVEAWGNPGFHYGSGYDMYEMHLR